MCDVCSLAVQLLELSRQLANSSKLFKLTLKTKVIHFNFSSHDRDLPAKTVKIKKRNVFEELVGPPAILKKTLVKPILWILNHPRNHYSVTNVSTNEHANMDGETKEHMECKETQVVPLPDLLHIQEDSPGWDVWCLN